MYCWSCGSQTKEHGRPCNHCGAPAAPVPATVSADHGIRVCTGCGYRGEGVRYFQRAGHAVLLAAATLLTYGLGGLVYWLVKRHDQVCPACGLSWRRSRPVGQALPASAGASGRGDANMPVSRPSSTAAPSDAAALPSSGMARRVTGVIFALLAVLLLGAGLVDGEAGLAVASLFFGLAGASTFAWGWKALQGRREALLRRLQGRVLHLARARGGRLTATDVASEMDLTLNGAERVLLSLDDGFRIRSDVTSEGLLVFDFPEIRFSGDRRAEGAYPGILGGQGESGRLARERPRSQPSDAGE